MFRTAQTRTGESARIVRLIGVGELDAFAERVCAVLNTCALLRGVDSDAFLGPWRLPSANREVHDH